MRPKCAAECEGLFPCCRNAALSSACAWRTCSFVLDVSRPRGEQCEQRQRTDETEQREHPTVATQDAQLLADDRADHA